MNNSKLETKIIVKINFYKHTAKDEIFFSNIDFELEQSKIIYLIGLSGIGKTTLLNVLLGNASGKLDGNIKYIIDGNELTSLKIKKFGLFGFLSQDTSLIPWYTIEQNLYLPTGLNNNLKKPSKEVLLEVLSQIGLPENILSQMPHELSLGMQTRVSFARAILYKPKFLFLDELFTGLDTINCDLISKMLIAYVKKYSVVCLSITHNIERAIETANSILILSNKRELSKIEAPFDKSKIINQLNNNQYLF